MLSVIIGISLIAYLPYLVGVPFVPTPREKVSMMLSLAEVKPGEVVYDLGSGDGRVVKIASGDFGARAIGIELSPLLVLWSRLSIMTSGLRSQARVIQGNLFKQDLSQSDLVTMFLMPKVIEGLKDKLEGELKPGARVVSYAFPVEGWEPHKADEEAGIYLYLIGEANQSRPAP